MDRIRVLTARSGLDGHGRGAKVPGRVLRGSGMEAVYEGSRQTPEMIVNAAFDEGVQATGLTIFPDAHHAIVPRTMRFLRHSVTMGVPAVTGGIVPGKDANKLKKQGVATVVRPGAARGITAGFVRRPARQLA
jgi:methylmalonyl-CoA mutase C-terminal domain/subunit